jgi:hypothetical protein
MSYGRVPPPNKLQQGYGGTVANGGGEVGVTALENEVGIRQCRPKCRPINLPGR